MVGKLAAGLGVAEAHADIAANSAMMDNLRTTQDKGAGMTHGSACGCP
jgi:hypothetical protein